MGRVEVSVWGMCVCVCASLITYGQSHHVFAAYTRPQALIHYSTKANGDGDFACSLSLSLLNVSVSDF